MGRRKKPTTRNELFSHILNKWLESEKKMLSVWGIGRKDISRIKLIEEYKSYNELWEKFNEEN